MNSRDIHNLQKAYLEVYQDIDEAQYTSPPQPAAEVRPAPAKKNKLDPGATVGAGIAAAYLGNEAGKSLARRARKDAKKPRGVFEDIYDIDEAQYTAPPQPAAEVRPASRQSAAGRAAMAAFGTIAAADHLRKEIEWSKKGKRKKTAPPVKPTFREDVDVYDIILSHLLDEGYADTAKNAEVIMVNMSEEWRDEILESNLGRNLALGALAAYTGMVGARGLPAGRAPDIKPDRPKTEIVMPAGKTAKPPTGTRAKLGGVSGTMWKEPGTSQTSYKDTTYFKRDAGKGPDSYRTFARNDYSGKYKPLGQGV